MLNHIGTQTIKTKRLTLRRFMLDDADAMFANWANDAEVSKYLTWEPHGDIAVTKAVISTWLDEYQNKNVYNWVIELNGDIIGSIGVLKSNDELCEAEAGYCLAKAYWNQGIMTEAYQAVLDFAFSNVGFQRVYAKHHIDNPNSGKVMRKCGMKYIETKNCPLALKPDKVVMCDCYEINSKIL